MQRDSYVNFTTLKACCAKCFTKNIVHNVKNVVLCKMFHKKYCTQCKTQPNKAYKFQSFITKFLTVGLTLMKNPTQLMKFCKNTSV